MTDLYKALSEQKNLREPVHKYISGMLGIPLDGERRVEVSNRNGFVYVRLRNNQSEVIQAFNNQVSPAYNLPVLVERRGNRYEVVSVDTQRYESNWPSFAPFLPRHGNTHSFDIETGGGGDIVWVYPRQFMPALVMPSGSAGGPNLIVNAYTLLNDDGTWRYIPATGTQNLTGHIPSSTSGAVMGLVYIEDGVPRVIVNSGTVFSNTLTGTSQVVPFIPAVANLATQIPLAAFRLTSGSNRLSWDNIYDVRQWIHTVPTGTGGAVGSTNLTGTSMGLPDRVVLTNGFGNMFTPDWLKWGQGFTNEFVEFGADETKEANAGKIGYKAFDDYFDIVGAGTGTGDRTVKVYDNLRVGNHLIMESLENGAVANLGINSQGRLVSGSAGGLATVEVQDEGIPLGSPTTFNFVGGNVDASISGSVVRVFVTGSTGGSSLDITIAGPSPGTIEGVTHIIVSGTYVLGDEPGPGVALLIQRSPLAVQDETVTVPIRGIEELVINDSAISQTGTSSFVRVYPRPNQGFGYNYKITPSSSNGTLTVALKTLDGNDPSADNPAVFRIGDGARRVTSALSFSLASGTNWFNAGGSELAGELVDYFIYAVWNEGSGGVQLGMSRLPYAKRLADLSSTSTSERYIAGATGETSDRCEVIGRFPATLSASPGRAWTVSVADYDVINHPIYETDWLEWNPVITGFSANPTLICRYKIFGRRLHLSQDFEAAGTSNATSYTETAPLVAAPDFSGTYFQYSPIALVRNNSAAEALGTIFIQNGSNVLTLRRSAMGLWTASGEKAAAFNIVLEI